MTSGQTVRISGGFEACVRQKIPNYLSDDSTPEVAIVTRFQDGPIVLYLGSELIDQVEEDHWYYFTIYDTEIELDVDPDHPEVFVRDIFNQGEALFIREVTPCEPHGIDSDHLQFTVD